MVVFDANVLVALLSPETSHDDRARLMHLIAGLQRARAFVAVPAPAFAEFLVRADDATTATLGVFERKQFLRVLPFDKKAAVQCALLDRIALASGNKRGPVPPTTPWQKVKVDRQVLAIALANNADAIIAEDKDLLALAAQVGLSCQRIEDLPLPEEAKQQKLDLPPPIAAAPSTRSPNT